MFGNSEIAKAFEAAYEVRVSELKKAQEKGDKDSRVLLSKISVLLKRNSMKSILRC